jgi:hypothetical protein
MGIQRFVLVVLGEKYHEVFTFFSCAMATVKGGLLSYEIRSLSTWGVANTFTTYGRDRPSK